MDPKDLVLKHLSGVFQILNSITSVSTPEDGRMIIRMVPPSDEMSEDLSDAIVANLGDLYCEHPVFNAVAKLFFDKDGRKNLILAIQAKADNEARPARSSKAA